MRVLYLAIGVLVIIQSVADKQWFGLLPGGYFAAMAVFRFGCAAGGCFSGSCNYDPAEKTAAKPGEAEVEKIKTKP
ncbi:MAG: hypothetical protein FD123_227 [Bacteroidetes bacterium]|nr:MAG: hypothetical protein FD123_227 [Bacteroidota bacterium]